MGTDEKKQIFVHSETSGIRVKKSITKFIEVKMRLKVNQEKSELRNCWEVNFLGHSILAGGKNGGVRGRQSQIIFFFIIIFASYFNLCTYKFTYSLISRNRSNCNKTE